jgi:Na+-transporting NADH:ubiquinone oxidoreductase subunit C
MIKDILALPNDSTKKTVVVAAALCLICSVLVSAAAVFLKPQQQYNKALDKRRNILEIAGLMEPGKSVDELFKKIETRVIDLESGEYVEMENPGAYDQRKASKDPSMSERLAAADDIASIKRQADKASVYLVKEGDQLKTIILPVHGYGLWSTLYGFLALEADANTITGFGFYEHAETPGLGGEVDNPNWRAMWPGKFVYDQSGNVAIEVIKGSVDASTPNAQHKVDGLAGATLTSRGVKNLLRFWMSDQGFGPYLKNIKAQKG